MVYQTGPSIFAKRTLLVLLILSSNAHLVGGVPPSDASEARAASGGAAGLATCWGGRWAESPLSGA